MQEVESLLKTCFTEIEKLLSTKTVVGEPIVIEGNTIIPLICIGFGFGGGGGTGKSPKGEGEGTGAGTGGGGGIKPIGLIIINKDGVKIEPVKGTIATFAEKIAECCSRMMEKKMEMKQQGK